MFPAGPVRHDVTLALRLQKRLAPTSEDSPVTPQVFLQLFWKAIKKWYDDSASRHGAAIAYYTLFALAPVLLVVIAIAGMVFGDEAVRGQLVKEIAGLIGPDGAEAIQAILVRASEPREGIGASAIALVGLFLATTGAFLELQAALNKIWKVKVEQTALFDFKALLTRRLRSFGLVMAIGFLLMVSLSINAAVGAVVGWLGERAADWPRVLLGINQLVSLVIATSMFAVLYRVLPDVQLEWRHVWVGAVTTALLFAIGQRLIGLYLGSTAIASPFGAAGTVAIILVWVYYASQIVLLGAEFTYQYATYKEPEPQPMAGAVRDPVAAT
jgi:membrane protein